MVEVSKQCSIASVATDLSLMVYGFLDVDITCKFSANLHTRSVHLTYSNFEQVRVDYSNYKLKLFGSYKEHSKVCEWFFIFSIHWHQSFSWKNIIRLFLLHLDSAL